jgi:hypothetical protein
VRRIGALVGALLLGEQMAAVDGAVLGGGYGSGGRRSIAVDVVVARVVHGGAPR